MGDFPASTSEHHDVATGQAAPIGQLVQNWRDAHERALAYAAALGVPEGQGLAIDAVRAASAQSLTPGTNVIAATLEVLREKLAGDPVHAFLRWRLARALGIGADGRGIATSPPIHRRPMRYEPIRRGLRDRIGRRQMERHPAAAPVLYGTPLRRVRRSLGWTRAAHRRRLLLAC